ncbi:hypothetical protein HDV00_002199 [Rhizophlyctis rosea]|nr:hypothetical protein HDV00_002199 [Rhizophlyctis rosea]
MSQRERAEAFKAEGNALVAEKKYSAAVGKYTEAIALDPDNAVLFNGTQPSKTPTAASASTRATSKVSNAYIGQRADAYIGLMQYQHAIESLRQILRLDPDNAAVKAELKKAKKTMEETANSMVQQADESLLISKRIERWQRSKGMTPGVYSLPADSAARRILVAMEDFEQGRQKTMTLKTWEDDPSLPRGAAVAMNMGLEALTNALIRDHVVFYLSQGDQERQEKYTQWEFILIKCKMGIIGDGVKKLRQAATIHRLAKQNLPARDPKDRGAIFTKSWSRALYLEVAENILAGSAQADPKTFDIEEAWRLINDADKLLKEDHVQNYAPYPFDHYDFYVRHQEIIHSLRGLYHKIKARRDEELVLELEDGAGKVYRPSERESMRIMVEYSKAIDLTLKDDLAGWIYCNSLLETGLKAGLLKHGQAWDLWQKVQTFADAFKGWRDVPGEAFGPYKFNKGAMSGHGKPKKGDRNLPLIPAWDWVVSPGAPEGTQQKVHEALRDYHFGNHPKKHLMRSMQIPYGKGVLEGLREMKVEDVEGTD